MEPNHTFHLKILYEKQFFSSLDYYFAQSMGRIFSETNQIVLTTCAFISKKLAQGHVCVDIQEMRKAIQAVLENMTFTLPDAGTWRTSLIASDMVSQNSLTPIVMDDNDRLYLAKYYDFQCRLVHNIVRRIKLQSLDMAQDMFDDILNHVVSGRIEPEKNQQKAIKSAVLKPLTIISGGPGTGKTFITNTIKQVCYLSAQKLGLPEPKIICAAPTGKAASKMEKGRTIHSILKPLKHRPGFFFKKDNPLQADMLMIDESSMVDLGLLTRLFEAVPLNTRIVLLGDKDQLSSVQAGSVFADICRTQLLAPCINVLTHNFRSTGKNGILALSSAINANNPDRVEQILISDNYPDVIFESTEKNISVEKLLTPYITNGFSVLQKAENDESALKFLDFFKILCAHNSGKAGTLQVNHVCEKILRSKGNFGIQKRSFRQIVMVSKNDYHKGLFNGDTGIASERDTGKTVLFPDFNGKIKRFAYADLPGHDAAFAITVHKSQGSEFRTVLLIIPEKMSPVMTRQLLYTGVTRAKNKVVILGRMDIVKAAVRLDTKRNSGIEEHLKQEL